MLILGVNAYHGDSSACVVNGGKLVAAAEEERFIRIKHWAGFPEKSIDYCLKEVGCGLADVEHVAINTDPNAHLFKKAAYAVHNRFSPRMIMARLKNRRQRLTINDELDKAFPSEDIRAQIHYIEHHLSHIASAHLLSPFENSMAVSIDGFGDFSSAAWGPCHGAELNIEGRVLYPHSMGI